VGRRLSQPHNYRLLLPCLGYSVIEHSRGQDGPVGGDALRLLHLGDLFVGDAVVLEVLGPLGKAVGGRRPVPTPK
jgi:hypothetical protein